MKERRGKKKKQKNETNVSAFLLRWLFVASLIIVWYPPPLLGSFYRDGDGRAQKWNGWHGFWTRRRTDERERAKMPSGHDDDLWGRRIKQLRCSKPQLMTHIPCCFVSVGAKLNETILYNEKQPCWMGKKRRKKRNN